MLNPFNYWLKAFKHILLHVNVQKLMPITFLCTGCLINNRAHIKSATTTAFVLFIWTMMPKIMNGQSRNLYHIVYSSFFSFLLHFNSTFKWICILLLPQKAGYAICSTKFTKIVLLTPILQYLPVFLSKTPSVLIITIVFREYNW